MQHNKKNFLDWLHNPARKEPYVYFVGNGLPAAFVMKASIRQGIEDGILLATQKRISRFPVGKFEYRLQKSAIAGYGSFPLERHNGPKFVPAKSGAHPHLALSSHD